MKLLHTFDDVGGCAAGGGLNQTPTVQLGPWCQQMLVSTLGFFWFVIHTCGADVPQEGGRGRGRGTGRKKKKYAYPTRPIPLGHLCLTADYEIAHVVNVTGAGRQIDALMQARVRVETMDAIFARGLRVSRVDRAARVEGGFKVRLVPGGAARVAGATVGCRCCC